jgi:hypothetical protein
VKYLFRWSQPQSRRAGELAQNVAGDACRAAPRCGLMWLAVGLVGHTLDSLSGLSEQEVNITVHERASGVLARRAPPIMSKPLYSENDDVHAAGRPSECGGRIRKVTCAGGLAPDQKVRVALPSGSSGLNRRSGVMVLWCFSLHGDIPLFGR